MSRTANAVTWYQSRCDNSARRFAALKRMWCLIKSIKVRVAARLLRGLMGEGMSRSYKPPFASTRWPVVTRSSFLTGTATSGAQAAVWEE
jgi:hypothetical protein